MKREILSSDLVTFLYKFIFPAFFNLVFGFCTVLAWITDLEGKKGPPELLKWGFLVIWIALMIAQWFATRLLNRVEVDSSMIYLSGFFHKEVVPLNQIESVSQGLRHSYVEIVFRQDTRFGKKVAFIPSMRVLFRTNQSMSIYLQNIAGIDKSNK